MLSIDTPSLIKAKALSNGHVVKINDNIVRYVGGFCVVFPFQISNNKKYAVRCWFVNVADAKTRTKLIAEELLKVNLPYFVGFEYIDEGIITDLGVQPIVLMDWIEAKPLKIYLEEHLNDSLAIAHLADKFKKMVAELHMYNLAHGDLQHGNIMVKDNGDIVLVDYDSMYVPALEGYKDEIKGLEGYQHRARWNNDYMTPKVDYFSELIIYTSLKTLSIYPDLWSKLNIGDSDTLLFTSEDLASRGNSPIFVVLDSDSKLKNLSRAIKQALNKTNIEDLLPLEEALVFPQEKIVKEMKSQWENNGYVKPCANYDSIVDSAKDIWDDNGYMVEKYDTEADIKETMKKW